MKVLLLTPMFHPDKGGAALAFNYLSRIFANNQRVSEIIVLTSWKKGRKLFQENGKITVARLLNYGINPQQHPVLLFIWNVLVTREMIERFAPGMIIFHTVILPFREYYGQLFNNCPAKTIYLYKTDLYPVRDFPELTGVVYLSRNLKNMLIRDWKIPASKLIYAPILFRPPRRPKTGKTGKPYPCNYILYVGAVNPLKGVYELIRAFKILKQNHEFQHLKLILIGPGPGSVSYDADVIFLKGMPRPQVYRYIEYARVVVLPSYSEGLPRVALETLYLKKPLIISNVVEETRGLPPSQVLHRIEPGEIAEKIKGILSGEPYTTDFPWETIAFKRTKEIWNEILNANSGTTDKTPAREAGYNHLSTGDFQVLRQTAKICAAAVTESDEFIAIPPDVKQKIPGLEKIPFIFLLKDLNREKRLDYLSKAAQTRYLMDHEKKIILKNMLIKLEIQWRIYLNAGEVKPLFMPLVPLTSEDMLFLGEYFLRGRHAGEAREYLLKGLTLLPESTHLEIYRHLLKTEEPLLTIKERTTAAERFRLYLESIPPGDLIEILEEYHLPFVETFIDIGRVLETCVRDQQLHSRERGIDFQVKLFFLMAAYKEMKGEAVWEIYFQRALQALSKKKDKQTHEIYRLASIYKRLKNNSRAAAEFKKVIYTGVDTRLISGAYFHLGEMAYLGGKTAESSYYFRHCLLLNPNHNKARKYLNRLKAESY